MAPPTQPAGCSSCLTLQRGSFIFDVDKRSLAAASRKSLAQHYTEVAVASVDLSRLQSLFEIWVPFAQELFASSLIRGDRRKDRI